MSGNNFEVDLFEVEPYDDPYVRTPLAWCRAGLHWEDLGMLTWLRSHQTGFQFNEAFIIKASPAGRDKVRAILARLERAGFLKRTRVRDTEGRLRGAKLTLRASADPVVAAMRAARQQTPAPGTENPSLGVDQHEHPVSRGDDAPRTDFPSVDSDQEKHDVSAGRNLIPGFPTLANPQQRKNIIKEPPPPTPSTGSTETHETVVARPEAAEAEETNTAASALVAALPGPLTAGQRHRLAAAVAARLEAGWTPAALTAELTADLNGVRSYDAVYRHRLAGLPAGPPAEAPAPQADLPPLGGEPHAFEVDPADPLSCLRCPRPEANRIHTNVSDQISRTKTARPTSGVGPGTSDPAQARTGRRGTTPMPVGDTVAAVLAGAGVGRDA